MRLLLGIFAFTFLVMLGALTPLRMALGWANTSQAGLSAQAVSGTIWSGRLEGASFQGLGLGETRAGLAPLATLASGPAIWLAPQGDLRGRAVVRLGKAGIAIQDADLSAPLARLAPRLPLQGDLTLTDFSAAFSAEGCRHATGQVGISALRLGGSPAVPGLRLAGEARCEAGRLVVPLAGSASGVSVQARLQVDAAGGYVLATTLRATDPVVAAAAGVAGFERTLEGFTRTDRGRLGG